MTKFEKAKVITGIVFHSIWLVVAVLLWVFGLIGFIESMDTMGFGAWAVWGVLCAIPIVGAILKNAISAGRDNAREGERVYTAERVGDTVYFRDQSWSYGFWGFVGGLVGGVLLGQVILPFFVVREIKYLINAALILKYSGDAE